MTSDATIPQPKHDKPVVIRGARIAHGPREAAPAMIEIVSGRIKSIDTNPFFEDAADPGARTIDLGGFLVMPGLINAHDHLGFALFPRIGDPPYGNYIQWGEDIHDQFADVIAGYRAIPKRNRLWWSGIRNLLCGVTTVSHHDPLWPELVRDDFPVRVIRQNTWAHSLAFGGDLAAKRAATPEGCAFILHACEGVDETAHSELWELDGLGLLKTGTVLVHGLAVESKGVALLIARQTSLIVCPSSNDFLFGKLPEMPLLSAVGRVALGNDSPLTAAGDLLDEIHFAIDRCGISPDQAYRMVTTAPAEILRLRNGEGAINECGVGDLIAIRDTGGDPADRLQSLSMRDVEFVMIGGRVQLASETLMDRLPLSESEGLNALSIGTEIRWLRAPVADLLSKTEEVLGTDKVRLGGMTLRQAGQREVGHAG